MSRDRALALTRHTPEPLVLPASSFQVWRLVTYLVTHMGLIHVAAAVYVQLSFVTYIESQWGTAALVQLFCATGIAGGVYSVVLLPNSISSGASGALYGVVGAHATNWALHLWEGDEVQRAWRWAYMKRLLLGVAFLIVFSFVPGINWAAHLFGMLTGALLAVWMFAGLPLALPQPTHVVRAARYAALAAYFVILLAGLVTVFTAGTQPRYLLHLCAEVIQRDHPGFTCWSP